MRDERVVSMRKSKDVEFAREGTKRSTSPKRLSCGSVRQPDLSTRREAATCRSNCDTPRRLLLLGDLKPSLFGLCSLSSESIVCVCLNRFCAQNDAGPQMRRRTGVRIEIAIPRRPPASRQHDREATAVSKESLPSGHAQTLGGAPDTACRNIC